MTIKDDFNGAYYGLELVELEDLTNIVIPTDTGIKVVILLSASTVDFENASAEILNIDYSQNGGNWSSDGETSVPGIEYTIYRSARNVIRNNPENLVAVTIDVPSYEYTHESKTYRQIEFKLHLTTEGGSFIANLEELITQKGCHS